MRASRPVRASRPWAGTPAPILAALPLLLTLSCGPGASPRGSTPPEPPGGAIPGFTDEGARAQRAWEARFLGALSRDAARGRVVEHARALTREPHLAGTDGAARTAGWLVATLEELGFQVEVDRYRPWLPHPVAVRVEVLEPSGGRTPSGARVLPAREPVPATAPPALMADAPELLSWHAYAGDGLAEGEVVYVNRGLAEDYAVLDSLGIEVEGRIVLARLGGAFRGVKAHEAERRGATGLLLFPDPADDGWAVGDTLPAGPYRPTRSVQRGTMMYMWRHTGDPATPGEPSREGRLPESPPPGAVAEGGGPGPRPEPLDSAVNLPSIPVAPVDAHEAGRLLVALDGPEPPARFRGALDASYSPGPGPLRVRVEVRQDWAPRTVRNVIARLPGRTEAEVILGNHFDAWVLGGVDPHSGTVAMLEIAHGLAELAESGWRPRRGVTLAFWDAEEFGVVGSTEWVEDHQERLRDRAVAYLNVDVFTAGVLDVQGSPALRDLVVSAAEAVPDPVTGRSLAELWGDRAPDSMPRMGDIGAGSDWTAFLHHAGIPSLQWTMNGRGTYAVYHSVYDDGHYLRRWADSAFVHTPAFAGAMGLAALRLAEAETLPFRYADYADRIEEHLAALEERHGIRLGPEREAVDDFREAASAMERRQGAALGAGDPTALARLDDAIRRVEAAFLDPEGLPGRPWYRHVLSAPGAATGYAARPLPGVAEALDAGDGAALARARAQVVAALERGTQVLGGRGGVGNLLGMFPCSVRSPCAPGAEGAPGHVPALRWYTEADTAGRAAMPANLNHAYYEAEERYREAVTREEKIAALEEMLRVMPKHKGTDKLQADLKSRISKLKRQPAKKGAGRGPSYRVQREGAGQVALVGPPNSGKSALVAALTHADPEVAPYPMTTRAATPGMMPFEDVAFQLVDLPPVCEEYVEFWVWDNIRGADLAWLVLSAQRPLEGMDLVQRLLGEKALGLVPWNDDGPRPSGDAGRGPTYKPTLLVVTGVDRPGARGDLEAFEELLEHPWPRVAVSSETGEGFDELGRATFEALGVIRVYAKQPGKHSDRDRPFTLPRGATVADLARKIHEDLLDDFKFARLWGESAFDGQRVPGSHVLAEGDVVEVHV